MYSKLQARQSWIERERMKPYWFLCTSLSITGCNLSARILVRIFKLMFNNEMGLKSLTVSGCPTLGTKVMNELLMHSKFATPV